MITLPRVSFKLKIHNINTHISRLFVNVPLTVNGLVIKVHKIISILLL